MGFEKQCEFSKHYRNVHLKMVTMAIICYVGFATIKKEKKMDGLQIYLLF